MVGDRRFRAAGLVLLLFALALVFWWRRGGERTPADADSGRQRESVEPDENTGQSGLPRPELAPSVEYLSRALADYLVVAEYPPWSRPHDQGTEYKLRWNEPVTVDLPFLEDATRSLVFRFASDRAHVGFAEPLTSWIEVWDRRAPSKLLPVEIVQAWVISASEHQGRKLSLEYVDDGSGGDAVAGDHRYSNRLVPSEHEELAEPQQVRILAEVAVGEESRLITRDFTYTGKPVLEILSVRDAIAGGSLVVTLEVEVYQPGIHTFEANAMSGDGEVPIAYVDVSHTLGEGKHSVDLTFFGKIFHDLDLDGPYSIRDLRGFLRDLDGGVNQHWSDPRTHKTQPYRRTDFSGEAWDSEEKREKIRGFEMLIEQTREGELGPPGVDENFGRPGQPIP